MDYKLKSVQVYLKPCTDKELKAQLVEMRKKVQYIKKNVVSKSVLTDLILTAVLKNQKVLDKLVDKWLLKNDIQKS